jgi:hypothetical protein
MSQALLNSIWVERDRYHTAIVLSSQLVRDLSVELLPVLNDRPLVRFGWGDRGYYGASHKSFFKALNALCLPTRSVMEVSTFDKLSDVGERIVQLNLDDLGVQKLLAFIVKSFTWDSSGLPILERVSVNGFHYYDARGVYHMFKNCNNWTAKALKLSGLKVRYWRAFFADSVMKQLDKLPNPGIIS